MYRNGFEKRLPPREVTDIREWRSERDQRQANLADNDRAKYDAAAAAQQAERAAAEAGSTPDVPTRPTPIGGKLYERSQRDIERIIPISGAIIVPIGQKPS